MMSGEKYDVLVCGAGGFIGGHLVGELKHGGGAVRIRAVDFNRWQNGISAATASRISSSI